MKKAKVIGIGFHKTGTSTLEVALTRLGYRVAGYQKQAAKLLFDKDYDPIFNLMDEYDAFQDNPWPLLYKEIDERYPGSKFILTLRDESNWLKSITNHFSGLHTEMRRYIYGVGTPQGNEEIYLKRFRRHNKEVTEYFKSRPDDLLVVDWEKGDGWNEICEFLEETIPPNAFPHANKGTYSPIRKQMGRWRKVFSEFKKKVTK